MFCLLLLSSLILPLSLSWNPPDLFPSCFLPNVTWQPEDLLDVVFSLSSPELCQAACQGEKQCAGFTWLSQDSDQFLPKHSCVFYSQAGGDTHSTVGTVSGPPECPCTMTGECRTEDHNVLQVFSDIETAVECSTLCQVVEGCVAYTLFTAGHPLENLCILYSSCQDFDDTCEACITGVGHDDCRVCSYENTLAQQCEATTTTTTTSTTTTPVACSQPATLLSVAPPVAGLESSSMVLCDDPTDETCEMDQETLCPAGFHLCTHPEFVALNDNWQYAIPKADTPVGGIYCRDSTRAGHYTLGYKTADPIPLSIDEPMNCHYGSSRPQCDAFSDSVSACNEKYVSALCCSSNPSCGDGVVAAPLEECDDGNDSDEDDCLNTCTWRIPDEHGYTC